MDAEAFAHSFYFGFLCTQRNAIFFAHNCFNQHSLLLKVRTAWRDRPAVRKAAIRGSAQNRRPEIAPLYFLSTSVPSEQLTPQKSLP